MHSEFQIEHFIVGRGNFTPYARYKQAVREIEKRERAADELLLTIEEQTLDLEAARKRWCFTRWQRRKRGNELIRKRLALASARRTFEENEFELQRFHELAAEARGELGEITTERIGQLDAEMWESKLRAMVATDLIVQGRLSGPTLELLVSIPQEIRQPILADMRETLEALRIGRDGPLVRALLGVNKESPVSDSS